ncbi:uncharacterized protein LOC141902540 [Tubulanus polymorphus]|uniref:uncharacterized protein LOC141902540 n=1 Tax=Tubulanus polymorphus TaxID=672921 RepID=UPI003DA4C8F1
MKIVNLLLQIGVIIMIHQHIGQCWAKGPLKKISQVSNLTRKNRDVSRHEPIYQQITNTSLNLSLKLESNSITGLKPQPEPKTEPKPEPESTSEPKPEPETTSKPEPESTSEPKPEPESTSEPKPEPETTSKPEPDSTSEPKPEPESTSEPKPEPESTSEPKPEPETTSEPKPEPETTSEPKPEPKTTSEPKPEPKTTSEPKPEPETTSEPKPEPETTSEPEPGTAEPSSEPPSEYPFAEPVPDWDVAKRLWGAAWDFHIYFVGIAFCILATYSLISVFRLYKRKHLLSQKFFISLNVIIFIMCSLRALYFMIDGYNSHKTFKPIAIDYFFYTSGFPCLTSAFSILFLALLQTTKVQLLPSKVQKTRYLVIIVVGHFTLSIATDIVVGSIASARVMLLICQLVSVIWGLFLFIGYFYIFSKLYKAARRRQKEILQLTLGKLRLPGITPIRKPPRLTLCLGVKVTFVTSLFGLVIAGLHIYAMSGVYGVFSSSQPEPWPWYMLHLFLRITEIVMCFLMSYIATQPFRYQKKTQKSCCDYYIVAPCRSICVANDYETREESIYWNEIHGVSVSYSPDDDLINRTNRYTIEESSPLNSEDDMLSSNRAQPFIREEEYKDIELGHGPIVLNPNVLYHRNSDLKMYETEERTLHLHDEFGETADFDFNPPTSSTSNLLDNMDPRNKILEPQRSTSVNNSVDPLGVMNKSPVLKKNSAPVTPKSLTPKSQTNFGFSPNSIRMLKRGYSNLENVDDDDDDDKSDDDDFDVTDFKHRAVRRCISEIQPSSNSCRPVESQRAKSAQDLNRSSIPECDDELDDEKPRIPLQVEVQIINKDPKINT